MGIDSFLCTTRFDIELDHRSREFVCFSYKYKIPYLMYPLVAVINGQLLKGVAVHVLETVKIQDPKVLLLGVLLGL